MGKLLVQEQERFGYFHWNASRYYDHPEGQDLMGKLKYLNKMALAIGTPIGLLALNFHPLPVSWREKTLRYFQCVLPAFGVATVFTCVTYFSTNIRKKDDELNYLLGGVSAGSVIGLVTGKPVTGAVCALVLGTIAVCQKTAVKNNTTLLPAVVPKRLPSYYLRMFDTSLEPERKGNWTK